MRSLTFAALFCATQVALMINSNGAAVITKWTFEKGLSFAVLNRTSFSLSADIGTGTATGVHASAASDWTSPSGNGSAKSFSSNTWAINDYWQFSIATTGFEDILLNWSQTSSSDGPGEFKLAYQVNGGGFTDFLSYTVLPNQAAAPGLGDWSSGAEITGYNFSVDLTALSGLDNAASVDFRLIMRTTDDATPPGTVAATGNSRIDNFTVSGTAMVPEPSTGLLGLIAAACLPLRRRRK